MTIREGVSNLLDRLNNSGLSQREKQPIIKDARARLNNILENRGGDGGDSGDATKNLRELSKRVDNAVEDGGLSARQGAKLQERIKNAAGGGGDSGGGDGGVRRARHRADDPTRAVDRPDRPDRPDSDRRGAQAEARLGEHLGSRLITKA